MKERMRMPVPGKIRFRPPEYDPYTLLLDAHRRNMSNRDTQFQGFAKALVTEIINEVPATIYPLEIDISDKLEKLLARRAYDLVDFAIFHIAVEMSKDSSVMFLPRSDVVKYIPDITELPREQE